MNYVGTLKFQMEKMFIKSMLYMQALDQNYFKAKGSQDKKSMVMIIFYIKKMLYLSKL